MSGKDVKIYRIKFKNKDKMLAALYAFLQRTDVENPEVTIFPEGAAGSQDLRLSFSRNGDYGRTLPDEQTWKALTSMSQLQGIICVAGTDRTDTRRVSIQYGKDIVDDSSIILSFPNAPEGRLNSVEKRILGTFKEMSFS